MLVQNLLKTTLFIAAGAVLMLFFSATPARAQAELLSPVAAPYALAIAGMGFIAGYSAAPHIVRAWMERERKR